MRYFTRELYEFISQAALGPIDDGFEARVSEENRRWQEAGKCYLDYLRQHDAQLSDAVRKLTSYALHDARITRAQKYNDSVTLLLDTRHAPLFKNASLHLVFLGVRAASGFDNLVNQIILYEELYVHHDGTFEFSALCTRSEFSLRFVDVEITSMSA